MQTIDRLYKDYKPLYPMERFCDTSSALFVDIETTGLKKETTSLYLIGCGYYTCEGLQTRLFFAECEDEERIILDSFADFVKGFTHLFHFNGLRFDIPYLQYKADQYGITGLFDHTQQIDVYKLCKPLRYLLFPDSMKQKSIESFLGINRDDKYNGGELIDVYKRFVLTKNLDDLNLLITHNREDVTGMHLIMPILYYLDLKDAILSYDGYSVNSYNDYEGNKLEEVIFEYTLDHDLPCSFSARTESMFIKVNVDNRKLLIRLPIYDFDMKIYFEDYRNYCYLPEEDKAILRTIAMALPKDRYKKATKETCYQKVSGKFVKQPGNLFTPVLKTDLKDKKKYFRFPEDFQKEKAEQFGRDLLNVFFTMKRR